MKKIKGLNLIPGLLALAIFTWLIWPKAVTPTEVAETKPKPKKTVVANSRKPDRESALTPIKKVPHPVEVEPSIKRLDPDAKIDDSYRVQQNKALTEGYGSFPEVKIDGNNPQQRHVIEALKNPVKNGGSFSITGKRAKFDIGRYRQESSYYLNSVEPGRAFDAATPGPSVTRLERMGNSSLRAVQDKSVTLQAKGSKGMPISFTVFDGGHFQNGLSFITLKADAFGVAIAEFTPTQGVINQTRIRAASPVNSGTLEWIINVHLNNQKDQK